MVFNLNDAHVVHVLAAYGAAALLVGGLALFTVTAYRRAAKK